MATLYIDTSYYLSIALFSKDYSLVNIKKLKESKSSKVLHFEIQKLLQAENLSLKTDIENLVISSGPGSYTGIRLAEGIAQLLEMIGVKVFSFYHFDLLEKSQKLAWISKAYKGEYFLYNADLAEMSLIQKDDLLEVTQEYNKIYTHFLDSFDLDLQRDIESTFDMFIDHSVTVLPQIINQKTRKTPFYYRKLEDEFKVSVGG